MEAKDKVKNYRDRRDNLTVDNVDIDGAIRTVYILKLQEKDGTENFVRYFTEKIKGKNHRYYIDESIHLKNGKGKVKSKPLVGEEKKEIMNDIFEKIKKLEKESKSPKSKSPKSKSPKSKSPNDKTKLYFYDSEKKIFRSVKQKDKKYFYKSKGSDYEVPKKSVLTEEQKESKKESKKQTKKSPKKITCDFSGSIPKKDMPKLYVCDENKFKLVRSSNLTVKSAGQEIPIGKKRTYYFKTNPNNEKISNKT